MRIRKVTSKKAIKIGCEKNIENRNKKGTARTRAKPSMFRPPFHVYGAVITFKKLNEKKKMKFFFLKFEFF